MSASLHSGDRLAIVVIFLLLQFYSFVVQFYKVSQEGISAILTSKLSGWQRLLLQSPFFTFLKRDTRREGSPEDGITMGSRSGNPDLGNTANRGPRNQHDGVHGIGGRGTTKPLRDPSSPAGHRAGYSLTRSVSS